MIRLATEDDFPAIIELCREFWTHTQFSEDFDAEHCLGMVKLSHDHELLAVLVVNDIVQGFCAAVKSFLLASTQAMTATELAWWVNPDHRGGKNGVVLLQFMEQLAKDQGIKYWSMVSMESSMPETINRMYERLGYTKSETIYTKVI
jgi:N-acetylglutamate synthase-like GNAT family acetyltransferase